MHSSLAFLTQARSDKEKSEENNRISLCFHAGSGQFATS